MATAEDAKLILNLYELRREATMRKARDWYVLGFNPKSAQDVLKLFEDIEHPEYNAYFRQVASYWDMACALVNKGALDSDLFFETSGEVLGFWSKIVDVYPQLASPEMFGPEFLSNVKKFIDSRPEAAPRVAFIKQRFSVMAEKFAARMKAKS
jgi:hypothetical protein